MADLTTSARDAIASGELVEEYRVGPQGRMVRRGKITEQVDAAIKLEALASRRANGIFRLAKLRGDP